LGLRALYKYKDAKILPMTSVHLACSS